LISKGFWKRNKNSEFLLLRSSSSELTALYFAMGDVAMSLINSVYLLDALSKAKVINEAETSPH
jgi:hypothetical protein